MKRTRNNFEAISKWVDKTNWVDFLAKEPSTRSSTSICLSIVDKWFLNLTKFEQKNFSDRIVQHLDNEGVALFALRHGDYETLAMNIAEIRQLIGEYVIILKQYKEYY